MARILLLNLNMMEKLRYAFILDKDEFFRLSLNKMLRKYGFQVEEFEDFTQLEKKKKEIETGLVLADVDMEILEKNISLIKRWNDRFILMTPLVTDEMNLRLKKMGIHRIIKKPVEPKLLKKAIREISFPDESETLSLG
ncbi:MAG: response regulator [Thermodesulfobacteriota bacterium]